MPIPMELSHASDAFDRFLAEAGDQSGLTTRNQTYTMTQGVLLTFRRRLTVAEAIRFASVLPPVLRAIFVADWDPEDSKRPFADRATLTREVQALRRDHNFSPDTAIRDVAIALRHAVDAEAFDRVLATLPAAAAAFWSIEPENDDSTGRNDAPRPPALDPCQIEPVTGSQPPHYPPPHDHLLDGRKKRRLGDALGLNDFGVNLVELPPGGVSALRHWHSHEDEFVYILTGTATLVTDEGAQPLSPGLAAGFPKGVPNGHQIRNDGAAPLIYLEIGSRNPADIALYPDAGLRTRRDIAFTDITE